MTDAVEIALITTAGSIICAMFGVLIVLLNKLRVTVNGRLTELIQQHHKADVAQGRQDERDSQNSG